MEIVEDSEGEVGGSVEGCEVKAGEEGGKAVDVDADDEEDAPVEEVAVLVDEGVDTDEDEAVAEDADEVVFE